MSSQSFKRGRVRWRGRGSQQDPRLQHSGWRRLHTAFVHPEDVMAELQKCQLCKLNLYQTIFISSKMPMYSTFNCFLGCIYTVYYVVYIVFIGSESDHWLCLSLTHSLTNWLTHLLLFSKLYWCDVWLVKMPTQNLLRFLLLLMLIVKLSLVEMLMFCSSISSENCW